MPYCIQYDHEGVKKTIADNKPVKPPKVLIVAVMVIAIFVGLLSCSYGRLYRYLLPGDPDITETALGVFAENVANGYSFMDAAEVFCRTILDNASVCYE